MKKKRDVKPIVRTRKARRPSLFIVIPLILISLFVIAATIYKIVEISLTQNRPGNLPKLEISLAEAPIEQIDAGDKDTKYQNNSITFSDDESSSFKNVEIKGRGNSTWRQIKKPYQLKFEDKENFFNLGESKKWVLLANYLDSTYLRNDIAFYLEKLLDEEYRIGGSFIEMYIDDNYRGLYYLSEKVEIDNSRVNLKSPLGVLVELDNIYGDLEGCHYSEDNDCIIVKDLNNKDSEDTIMQDFIDNFNLIRSAAKQKDYTKLNSLIDVDSFVKYYLLNEFTVNPDAYSTSFFMYKDGEDDKIHAGPGWDFDLALGNKTWTLESIDQNTFNSPFETMALKSYLNEGSPHTSTVSTILYDLMDIPEFYERVKEIYQETLSGKSDEILSYIKSQAEHIKPAVLRDQERWRLKANFDEEVDYLTDWVAKRYDHFEETYGKNSTNLVLDPELNFAPIPEEAPESPQPSEE